MNASTHPIKEVVQSSMSNNDDFDAGFSVVTHKKSPKGKDRKKNSTIAVANQVTIHNKENAPGDQTKTTKFSQADFPALDKTSTMSPKMVSGTTKQNSSKVALPQQNKKFNTSDDDFPALKQVNSNLTKSTASNTGEKPIVVVNLPGQHKKLNTSDDGSSDLKKNCNEISKVKAATGDQKTGIKVALPAQPKKPSSSDSGPSHQKTTHSAKDKVSDRVISSITMKDNQSIHSPVNQQHHKGPPLPAGNVDEKSTKVARVPAHQKITLLKTSAANPLIEVKYVTAQQNGSSRLAVAMSAPKNVLVSMSKHAETALMKNGEKSWLVTGIHMEPLQILTKWMIAFCKSPRTPQLDCSKLSAGQWILLWRAASELGIDEACKQLNRQARYTATSFGFRDVLYAWSIAAKSNVEQAKKALQHELHQYAWMAHGSLSLEHLESLQKVAPNESFTVSAIGKFIKNLYKEGSDSVPEQVIEAASPSLKVLLVAELKATRYQTAFSNERQAEKAKQDGSIFDNKNFSVKCQARNQKARQEATAAAKLVQKTTVPVKTQNVSRGSELTRKQPAPVTFSVEPSSQNVQRTDSAKSPQTHQIVPGNVHGPGKLAINTKSVKPLVTSEDAQLKSARDVSSVDPKPSKTDSFSSAEKPLNGGPILDPETKQGGDIESQSKSLPKKLRGKNKAKATTIVRPEVSATHEPIITHQKSQKSKIKSPSTETSPRSLKSKLEVPKLADEDRSGTSNHNLKISGSSSENEAKKIGNLEQKKVVPQVNAASAQQIDLIAQAPKAVVENDVVKNARGVKSPASSDKEAPSISKIEGVKKSVDSAETTPLLSPSPRHRVIPNFLYGPVSEDDEAMSPVQDPTEKAEKVILATSLGDPEPAIIKSPEKIEEVTCTRKLAEPTENVLSVGAGPVEVQEKPQPRVFRSPEAKAETQPESSPCTASSSTAMTLQSSPVYAAPCSSNSQSPTHSPYEYAKMFITSEGLEICVRLGPRPTQGALKQFESINKFEDFAAEEINRRRDSESERTKTDFDKSA